MSSRIAAGLIVLGALLIALGIGLRQISVVASETVTKVPGQPTETTRTTKPFSDALLISLVGLGGAFVLCGVFYREISEVTLPGGLGLKLVRQQAEAAEAVARALDRELAPNAPKEALAAAKASVAATVAIARTVERSYLGSVIEAPAPQRPSGWDEIAEHALREALAEIEQPSSVDTAAPS